MSRDQHLFAGYTVPFFTFVALMGLEHVAGLQSAVFYPLRLLAVSLALIAFSRPYLSFRPRMPLASILLGVAVFAIWVGPDLLFRYRHSVLFDNGLIGHPESTMPAALHTNIPFLAIRMAGATLLVPIIEELFWRGWLMRWLINPRFQNIKFGAYAPAAFWITAVLFACEHGSYWEVGLIAGVLYNWWAIRTGSLADCILAHAVTNGVLSAYVLLTGQWQYWS